MMQVESTNARADSTESTQTSISSFGSRPIRCAHVGFWSRAKQVCCQSIDVEITVQTVQTSNAAMALTVCSIKTTLKRGHSAGVSGHLVLFRELSTVLGDPARLRPIRSFVGTVSPRFRRDLE